MAIDLTRDITYRDFLLNDEDLPLAEVGGGGTGTGISGSIVDSADFSDVDVVQFLEKRSQGDGMDAGDVFLGMRRLRLAGTLYDVDRPSLFDQLMSLRAALSPVLAQREEPGDRGYRPLYFSVPTNDTTNFPTGVIAMRCLAMPRAFQALAQRDQMGGDDDDPLAIPWQATFVCRDPTLQGASEQDYTLSAQTEQTGATISTGDLVTKASHGLSIGDRVRFTSLTGGTGLSTTITYYVVSSGFTSGAFKVSLTSGGAVVDVTVAYSDASFVKSVTDASNLTNRGTYLAPVNALWVVGAASGSISATVGDSIFTITIPASTVARTIRFKGEDKVLTVEEAGGSEVPHYDWLTFNNDTTWPLIDPGVSAYSFTVHGAVQTTGSHFWFWERYA